MAFDFVRLPRVSGHRGARGSAPENTLASIRKAAQIGVGFVECDVNLTADEVVVFHDYDLDRCTNGCGRLLKHGYATLSRLDAGSHFSTEFAGERIPRLAELIALLAQLQIGANIEIKSLPGNEAATVTAVAAIIHRCWPSDLPLLMSSFSEPVMALLARQLAEVSRGWLVKSVSPDWRAKLRQFEAVSLHCAEGALRRQQIAEVTQAGYRVVAYTVNTHDRAAQLLSWGVASVISDYPERMMDLASHSFEAVEKS